MRLTTLLFAVLAATAAPAELQAQLGEFHVGAIAGFGTADSYRAGGGVTIAVVPGRISFLGLRYVWQGGSDQTIAGNAQDFEVRTNSTTIAADLGLQFPVGGAELVIGASLGTVRFHQEFVSASSATTEEVVAWEFMAAPSITAYFRVGRFLIGPEFQWGLAGNPDFPVNLSHQGPLFNLRFVLPFEIDRIRQ